MPAKRFICPNGDEINMYECLLRCPQGTRCMFLPTLRAVATSLERNLTKPSVTELLSGTRELYLKKIHKSNCMLYMDQLYIQSQSVIPVAICFQKSV